MNRVLLLMGLSVLINYIDRSNLSIAAPLIKDELHISASQLGTLLSAFFWTYALLQIPAGWLVDRFDVKYVFAAGFLLWSAATAVTGVLHGFIALLAIRVVLGVGESIAFPSCGKIVGGHFPEHRRGIANAVIMAGLALGPAIGMLVGGTAIGRFGWRPFFVVLGAVALLWLVPWLLWMPRRPTPEHVPKMPWTGLLPIVLHRSAWGTCLGQFSINYYSYFMVTWLPFYLVRTRHLSMNAMARDGALYFLMSAMASLVCGKLTDRWIRAGTSPTLVRKTAMAVGHLGVGIFLLWTFLAGDRFFLAPLVLTGVFVGTAFCNTWAFSQTLAGPLMVGRWTGMQNFVGNLAGPIAPALTGLLLDRTGSFLWPFCITAVVAVLGAAAWTLIVGPLEEVLWEQAVPKALPISSSLAQT